MAFFPCIYFCAGSQMLMSWTDLNYRKLDTMQKTEKILERIVNREHFLIMAIKMLAVAKHRGLRLIMENPWAEQTYLKTSFILPPALIDKNRMMRGDYFVKPTAYWFINSTPTYGYSIQKDKVKKTIRSTKSSEKAGLCSEERSMISPDYARNFICDFILGKEQIGTQLTMFE